MTLVPPRKSRPNLIFVAPWITATALKAIKTTARIAIHFADLAEVLAAVVLWELLRADMRRKSRHLRLVCRKARSDCQRDFAHL